MILAFKNLQTNFQNKCQIKIVNRQKNPQTTKSVYWKECK